MFTKWLLSKTQRHYSCASEAVKPVRVVVDTDSRAAGRRNASAVATGEGE